MKVRSFITELFQLNTSLLYIPPDCLGQLVTSLPDDDIKENLHQAMPKTWEKKLLEQGYNYLDGPIHSMTEYFETRIEHLEKSINLIKCLSRKNKRNKKGSRKRKSVTSGDSEDKDSDDRHTGKRLCQYCGTCGHTTNTQCTGQASQAEKQQPLVKKERFTKHEVNFIVQKQDKKALKQKKRKHTRELCAFKNECF